jgi:hypothetical protein
MNLYDVQTFNQAYTQERGNILGVSVPHVNKWLTEGKVQRNLQCLIKLYDDHTRSFKLNENVTFIGILENTLTASQVNTTDDQPM